MNNIQSLFGAILISLFCVSCSEENPPASSASSPTSPETFYLGGIQVNEGDLNHWTHTLRKTGMNTVEVTVYINQADWDGDHLWWNEEEKWVVEEIRSARQEGLKVVLILRTSLHSFYPRNKFLWHGMILPADHEKIRNWFKQYRTFALKWGAICQQEGVEVLGIGSELNAMAATRPLTEIPDLYAYFNDVHRQRENEGRAFKYADVLRENDLWVRGDGQYADLRTYIQDKIEAQKKWAAQVTFEGQPDRLKKMNDRRQLIENQWISLIKDLRKIYDGKLTYAANFDNYQDVGFWEYLDFVGINAYFQLRPPTFGELPDTALLSVFRQSWRAIFDQIDQVKAADSIPDKPVMFTELGYVRAEDSTVAPWQGFGFSVVASAFFEKIILWNRQRPRPRERQLAVAALREVVREKKYPLAGILYWKLTTHAFHLPHEPFALLIANPPVDSLQWELARFLN
ncbi:MAG: hypothetical protein D6714_03820 [Bacteroidetes bacterium]|nr:MAG: hypothetical protein D6714_03820 [Bacteroidota bacterium]